MLTTFSDVLHDHSEVDVSVYDGDQEIFLGHVRFCPLLRLDETVTDWHQLQPRNGNERVTGEVKLSYRYERITKKHYGPEDFEKLRLIGKGKNS